jgi:RNA polymerase subunit RPABC4/transcription elongation factor Spt4
MLEYLVVGVLLITLIAFPIGLLIDRRRNTPKEPRPARPPAPTSRPASALRVQKYCNRCNVLTDADDNFCWNCGQGVRKLPPRPCVHCGGLMSSFDKVCWQCGRAPSTAGSGEEIVPYRS